MKRTEARPCKPASSAEKRSPTTQTGAQSIQAKPCTDSATSAASREANRPKWFLACILVCNAVSHLLSLPTHQTRRSGLIQPCPPTCPHCHADITPRYNFCPDCGTLPVEYAPAIARTVPAGFGIRLTALMVDNLVLALVNLALIYCFAPDGPESLSWSDWLPTITARFNVYYGGPWWLCLAAWSKDTLYSLVRSTPSGLVQSPVRLRSSPVVVGPQLAPERAEIPMGRTRPRGVRRKPKQLPTARANSHAGRQTRPDSRAEPRLPDRRRQSRPGTTLARRTDHDLMYALPRALPQYQGTRLAGEMVYPDRTVQVPRGCLHTGFIKDLESLIRRTCGQPVQQAITERAGMPVLRHHGHRLPGAFRFSLPTRRRCHYRLLNPGATDTAPTNVVYDHRPTSNDHSLTRHVKRHFGGSHQTIKEYNVASIRKQQREIHDIHLMRNRILRTGLHD